MCQVMDIWERRERTVLLALMQSQLEEGKSRGGELEPEGELTGGPLLQMSKFSPQ